LRSISELYIGVHCTSHARTRLQGDALVNHDMVHVLDTTVLREGNYTRKKCIS
jgi:hypothetical protein